MLFDEPLEAMDRSFRSLMIAWLSDLRDQGATLLVVSHEIGSFAPIADCAVTVHEGRAVLVEALGEAPGDRLATLDRLARGIVLRCST